MKNTNLINVAIIKAVASSQIKKAKLVFEVTGVNKNGQDGIITYNNGTLDRLPELVEQFQDLKSGSLWLTNAEKNRNLGKRILICRKGDKYIK